MGDFFDWLGNSGGDTVGPLTDMSANDLSGQVADSLSSGADTGMSVNDLSGQVADLLGGSNGGMSGLGSLFNQAQDSQTANVVPQALQQAAAPSPFSFNQAQDSQAANSALGSPFTSSSTAAPNTLQKIMKGMGLDGDLSNPKTLDSWMKLVMGGGGLLSRLMQGNQPINAMSPSQLRSSLPGGQYNNFTPGQQASADAYFNTPATPWNQRARQYSSSGPAPIAGHCEGGLVQHFAEGGSVADSGAVSDDGTIGMADGGYLAQMTPEDMAGAVANNGSVYQNPTTGMWYRAALSGGGPEDGPGTLVNFIASRTPSSQQGATDAIYGADGAQQSTMQDAGFQDGWMDKLVPLMILGMAGGAAAGALGGAGGAAASGAAAGPGEAGWGMGLDSVTGGSGALGVGGGAGAAAVAGPGEAGWGTDLGMETGATGAAASGGMSGSNVRSLLNTARNFTGGSGGSSAAPGGLSQVSTAAQQQVVPDAAAAAQADQFMGQSMKAPSRLFANSSSILPGGQYSSTVQPGRGYADGGATEGRGGQDDVVPANLAPGEFVFDADSVSGLGDGNNAEGARKLEAWRRALREHKRSAPLDKIPPRAKPVEAYLGRK